MQELIQKLLKNSIQTLYNAEISEIALEIPPKKELWDYAFWCFLLAKDLKKSPNLIAQELKDYIEQNISSENIKKLEIAGPYLNIFLDAESFVSSFESFMNQKSLYQGLENSDNKTIHIDYIGANVWKPLHIGHMCTPNQGQVFVNLFKKLDYNVVADSHLGDWGIIFWKLIVAYQKYGQEEALKENAVDHLFELYVKISSDAESDESLDAAFREAFKKLSSGDPQMKELWAEFTRYSIDAMNILLARLHVEPDYNIWESFYEWLGLQKMEDYPDLTYSMSEIVEELIDKNIATQNDDGSVGVVFPEESKIPSCILQKRDGTHGYLASDLASVKYRIHNWDIERIIYFVDARQQLHLKQVFEISKMAEWVDGNIELTHAYNGFISLKDGAMSTRKWKVIFLEQLLNEAQQRAKKIILEKRDDIDGEKLEWLSEIIGIGAIKYGYLKKTRTNDVIFDWDEFMSFEWNSGPYVQYAYVRAKRILQESWYAPVYQNLKFQNNEEKELIKWILEFPQIISEISHNYFAHILCQYVYELTKKFSLLYNNIQILSESDDDLKYSRLALVSAFVKIIEESFEILAIPLPEEM